MRKYNHKISERANESLRKREAVVRKQRTVLVVVIAVLVSLGILLGTSISTLASSEKDISSYNKYYTSVKIESGDTLWSIADEYIDNVDVSRAEYIDEICDINDISENDIHAGDYIVIPYYSDEIK
ncbi:MAG: LysM peptidoglycan-binding domain-containing protein [Agathobacter sp.]|nr:LysM peptidoglycan-binding domain-containing protein [Agathobacter sp.]